jgi:hypothetical protein
MIITLVWVLIIAPIHIVMGSVGVFENYISQNELTIQSEESSTVRHSFVEHHIAYDIENAATQCDQDNGCNGCDSCSHCLTVICIISDLHIAASQPLLFLPSLTLYQIDQVTNFRPPIHS